MWSQLWPLHIPTGQGGSFWNLPVDTKEREPEALWATGLQGHGWAQLGGQAGR